MGAFTTNDNDKGDKTKPKTTGLLYLKRKKDRKSTRLNSSHMA